MNKPFPQRAKIHRAFVEELTRKHGVLGSITQVMVDPTTM
jgi:hypothetical protein